MATSCTSRLTRRPRSMICIGVWTAVPRGQIFRMALLSGFLKRRNFREGGLRTLMDHWINTLSYLTPILVSGPSGFGEGNLSQPPKAKVSPPTIGLQSQEPTLAARRINFQIKTTTVGMATRPRQSLNAERGEAFLYMCHFLSTMPRLRKGGAYQWLARIVFTPCCVED